VTVKKKEKGEFLDGREEKVAGDDTLHVSKTRSVAADEEWRAAQGPTEMAFKEGSATLKAGGDVTLEVQGGRLKMEKGGVATLESNQRVALLCGDASIVLSPDKIEIAAPEVQITGSNGSMKLDRAGVTTTGLNVSSTALVKNEITGAFVKAN